MLGNVELVRTLFLDCETFFRSVFVDRKTELSHMIYMYIVYEPNNVCIQFDCLFSFQFWINFFDTLFEISVL